MDSLKIKDLPFTYWISFISELSKSIIRAGSDKRV